MNGEAQFVTLSLGEEVFAVPVTTVHAILDYRRPYSVPGGPPFLLGLLDVRECATPVIDLRTRLGLPQRPPDAATRILVLDVPLRAAAGGETAERNTAAYSGFPLGVVADRVLEVVTLKHDEIEAVSERGIAWTPDYITGLARRNGSFVLLLNLPLLLGVDDTDELSAAVGRAA
jgi:purine-binding chemotaxis protein CheW